MNLDAGKLASILRSPKFLYVTLVLFILQGLFLTVAIAPSLQTGDSYLQRSPGVVPDGNRHTQVVYFYAKAPILNGPFVGNMTSQEMTMGDLERLPSYLYHYLLSFPVRLAQAIGASELAIAIMLRLIGLAVGVLALIAFWRLSLALKVGPAIANLATLGLAFTGMFAFLSPAMNYDVFSLLLWFLYMLASVRLFIDRQPHQLYWMVVLGMLMSITKYTYLPFAGLLGLIAIWLYIRNSGGWAKAKQVTVKGFTKWLKAMRRWQQVALVLLLLISGGLFAERIGGNLVQYGAVSPKCTQIHSFEDCMRHSVFNRNQTRLQAIEAGETWTQKYSFIDYTGMWLGRYYASIYFYMGHIWVKPVWWALALSAATVLIFTLYAATRLILRKRAVLKGSAEWYILGTVGLFIAVQYLFNVNIFISYAGETYAHQGRYLLPIVGFVYILILLVAARYYRSVTKKRQPQALTILLIIGAIAFLANNSVTNFFINAKSPDWYSPAGRVIVPSSWYEN